MMPPRSTSLAARTTTALALGALLFACSADRAAKSPAAAAPAGYGGESSAQNTQQQPGYPQQPGGYPQPGQPAPPPPPEPAAPPAPGQLGGQPEGGGSSAASRTMAFSKAMDDVDTSQRQLDVAAGDCNNACRALGSMDRACGRLCALAQGSDEGRRCDDAKKKVYSARDRVKQTCSTCPDGVSVERSAPIPSVR